MGTAIAEPTDPVDVSPGVFVPVNATRLMDTRTSGGPVGGGGSITLPVTGVAGVPDSGVSAVTLSVTATGSATSGFLIVGPSGSSTPWVSNVNYAAGQNASNMVVVKVGSDGKVVVNASTSTHVVVDITGYYDTTSTADPAGGFVPTDPNRLLDTRVGVGAPAQRVASGTSVPLQVTGRGGVPSSGVSAVVLNVTAVHPDGAGWVTVSTSGKPVPGSSNLNYAAGAVVPNLVMVQVGEDGKTVLTANGTGSVDLLADVAGYFTDGDPIANGSFVPTTPSRALDTRSASAGHNAVVTGGQKVSVPIAGVAGVPSTGVSAVVVNLTATQATGGGFLTAYGTGSPVPGTSNLNYSTQQSAAVLAIVPLGSDGTITLFVQGNTQVHLLADISGYIPGDAAIHTTGRVYAWGANDVGQVGVGDTNQHLNPVLIPGLPEITSVIQGTRKAYALTPTGEIYAWGSNTSGQLGDGTTSDRATPAMIPGLSGVTQIFDRGSTTYALTTSGQLYAWGVNDRGQVGDGTTTTRTSPYAIPGLSDIRMVTGSITTFAVTTSGALYTWGSNSNGTVGDGTMVDRLEPYLVPGLPAITDVLGKTSSAIALTASGDVYSWGKNGSGQVGDGTTNPRLTPFLIPGLSDVASIQGSGTVFALAKSGQVYSWGNNVGGQIGDGMLISRLEPYLIPELSHIASLAIRSAEVYALTEAGEVYSWGHQSTDYGAEYATMTPYIMPGLPKVSEVSLPPSAGSSYAITSAGDLYSWPGGTVFGPGTPEQISGLSGVTAVGGVGVPSSVYALTETGEVYAWGGNRYGEVGDGTITSRPSPYLIPELNGISAVALANTAYAVRP